jgi:branched-chain amino acid aminotransferase
MKFAYFEGKIIPMEEAKVSIACNSLQYGISCFAGIRGYVRGGKAYLLRLKDHHARLMCGAKILGMEFSIPYLQFQEAVQELIRVNKPEGDFYLRPFIYSPTEQLAPKLGGLKFTCSIYMVPLGNYFDPAKGMRLMISSWRKFPDSSLPTKAKAGGCYVHAFLASNEAAMSGYDEALVTDQEGYIVEASVANLLMVYRGRLIVPEIGSAQLEGITLRSAVQIIESEGYSISFERIDRSMIYSCDELLLLGTAAQVQFASSVDGRNIGANPGPVCERLRGHFKRVIEGSHPRSQEWLMECAL